VAQDARSITIRELSKPSRRAAQPSSLLPASACTAHVKLVIPTRPGSLAQPQTIEGIDTRCSYRMPPSTTLDSEELAHQPRPSTGRLRRLQAAEISKSGPPMRAFKLRPLEPEPEDKVLGSDLLLEACNADVPEQAQVRVG
jgi:hypothetical protein